MRTPLGIGLVVGAVILLTLLALVHLTLSPRRTGRWLWLIVIVVLPVLGPLLYAIAGSRADPEDWDDLAAYRAEHVSAPADASPTPAAPERVETTPAATPTPSDVYRDDIDAPAIAVSAVDEGSTEDETSPDFTVRDDGAALPDFAVRDVHAPLTDDVPSESAYDALDAPPADGPVEDDNVRDEVAPQTEGDEAADVPTVEVEDPSEAPPLSSVSANDPPETTASPDRPRDHLRARRRKSR